MRIGGRLACRRCRTVGAQHYEAYYGRGAAESASLVERMSRPDKNLEQTVIVTAKRASASRSTAGTDPPSPHRPREPAGGEERARRTAADRRAHLVPQVRWEAQISDPVHRAENCAGFPWPFRLLVASGLPETTGLPASSRLLMNRNCSRNADRASRSGWTLPLRSKVPGRSLGGVSGVAPVRRSPTPALTRLAHTTQSSARSRSICRLQSPSLNRRTTCPLPT